jgi:F-type H+-transporting ATPase subunit epsilon
MADTFELVVATPERLLIQERVDDAQIPAVNGYLGILPGHSPLVSQLATGELSYASGGRRRYVSVNGGFVEVMPDQVRVLADHAEKADEIDVARAEASFARARERLEHPVPDMDVARALNAMQRAQARLAAAKH